MKIYKIKYHTKIFTNIKKINILSGTIENALHTIYIQDPLVTFPNEIIIDSINKIVDCYYITIKEPNNDGFIEIVNKSDTLHNSLDYIANNSTVNNYKKYMIVCNITGEVFNGDDITTLLTM